MNWSEDLAILAFIAWLAYLVLSVSILFRAILRPLRDPASRLAWVIVILVIPAVGVVAYLLIGEARISRKRRELFRKIDARLTRPSPDPSLAHQLAKSPHAAAFAVAGSVNGLAPTGGNGALLAANSNAAIEGMVADIDAATETVHLAFYIWLADHNGLKVKAALIRAVQRGVKVRALADALGSRSFHRSRHWQDLLAAGVDAKIALPVGGILWTLIRGRVDLRNHRKVLVIDNRIVWCGSQNCADPEFRIKPKFAPWVDIMTRWEGPVARDSQLLFALDWIGEGGDDISELIRREPADGNGEIAAQIVGTGPVLPYAAMTACFTSLIHSARRELVITTPYFVPDEQLLFALMTAARAGVAVTMVFPQRNDSKIVSAASRSSYAELLEAGVQIWEYRPGLLHAKTMVVDGEVALIGSANLDRRSFELNFENNILFADAGFARQIRARQDDWIAESDRVSKVEVAGYSLPLRLWQNLLAMMGPLL